MNLADNHRRLGSFDTANVHVAAARGLVPSLPDGPYADQMEQWIEQVADLITQRSIEPLSLVPEGVTDVQPSKN